MKIRRHRTLALDAASITDGAMDRLTPRQMQWLLFNRHVSTSLIEELPTAMLWEYQLFGTSYPDSREVIALHLAKVAACVAKSIGILETRVSSPRMGAIIREVGPD